MLLLMLGSHILDMVCNDDMRAVILDLDVRNLRPYIVSCINCSDPIEICVMLSPLVDVPRLKHSLQHVWIQ